MASKSSDSQLQLGLSGNFSFVAFQQTQVDETGISDKSAFFFTWAVYGVTCPTIAIFGIGTNIINIICFLKQDFKDSVNMSLLGLSVSDLGSLVTMAGINIMLNPSMIVADLPFDTMEVCYVIFTIPHMYFSRTSSWITALITLERCLCILAPLQIRSFTSPEKMFAIIVTIYISFLVATSPLYAVNRLGMTFSALRNKTLLGRISVTDREGVESISYVINNFIIPMIAFVIIVICTVTLVIKLNKTTKWRKKTVTPEQADRVSSRNKKVAKMVAMMSTLFIACFAPFCIVVLAFAYEPELSLGGRYLKIGVMLGGISFVLESVNSSGNIFIYYHMSSKYREAFRKVFSLKKDFEAFRK